MARQILAVNRQHDGGRHLATNCRGAGSSHCRRANADVVPGCLQRAYRATTGGQESRLVRRGIVGQPVQHRTPQDANPQRIGSPIRRQQCPQPGGEHAGALGGMAGCAMGQAQSQPRCRGLHDVDAIARSTPQRNGPTRMARPFAGGRAKRGRLQRVDVARWRWRRAGYVSRHEERGHAQHAVRPFCDLADAPAAAGLPRPPFCVPVLIQEPGHHEPALQQPARVRGFAAHDLGAAEFAEGMGCLRDGLESQGTAATVDI